MASSSSSRRYPVFPHTLEEVSADRDLFMKTLIELHQSMGTRLMTPEVAGQELDFHRFFVEVTSRGGIERVRIDKRMTEIARAFNFPSPTTNVSYMLRQHYGAYLYHYEQIFYFGAQEWNPSDVEQSPLPVPVPDPNVQQLLPEATSASSVGTVVTGVIDFEFEIGYVVTVTVGSKTLKGVLYHDPQNPALPKRPQHGSVPVNNESCSGESDSGNDKGIEHNMDDASAGMRGVAAENLSKEKEGNDDGDQPAQKRMRA